MFLGCGFFWIIIIVRQSCRGSVCPESKKLYPGDCRLFYKCVPVPESAQAYVWVPSRCTAGMVYDQRVEDCVQAKEGWDCEQKGEDFAVSSFYSLNRVGSVEDGTKMTDYSATSSVQSGSSTSGFNDDDKSTKINFISDSTNKPRVDSIGAQMHRLTQLINSLKATSFSRNDFVYSNLNHSRFPFNKTRLPVRQLNLLQKQIYKIMTQLISQTPNIHKTNLDLPRPQTKYSAISTNYTITKLVSDLFEKFLTNTTLLKDGEFVKSHSCKGTTQRLPHLQDCMKYFVCENGNFIEFLCPSNMAFNIIKNSCDNKEYLKCKKFKVKSVCLTEGSMVDPFSKKYFLICLKKDGKWIEHRVRCPGNLEYCVQKKICLSKAYCH